MMQDIMTVVNAGTWAEEGPKADEKGGGESNAKVDASKV